MKTACALISLYLAAAAQAALIIDHFDSPDNGQVVSLVNRPSGTGDTKVLTVDGVLGGSRQVSVTIQEQKVLQGDVYAGANRPGYRGYYSLEQSTDYNVVASLEYAGVTGDLGIDVTPFQGIALLGVVQDSSAFYYTVLVHTVAGGSSSSSITGPSLFAGDLFFPRASFVTASGGGVDWHNVGKIIVTVDPASRGGDMYMSAIVLVPEPAGGLLVGGVVAASVLWRLVRRGARIP